jgi:hypothetical protein
VAQRGFGGVSRPDEERDRRVSALVEATIGLTRLLLVLEDLRTSTTRHEEPRVKAMHYQRRPSRVAARSARLITDSLNSSTSAGTSGEDPPM